MLQKEAGLVVRKGIKRKLRMSELADEAVLMNSDK